MICVGGSFVEVVVEVDVVLIAMNDVTTKMQTLKRVQ